MIRSLSSIAVQATEQNKAKARERYVQLLWDGSDGSAQHGEEIVEIMETLGLTPQDVDRDQAIVNEMQFLEGTRASYVDARKAYDAAVAARLDAQAEYRKELARINEAFKQTNLNAMRAEADLKVAADASKRLTELREAHPTLVKPKAAAR